MAEDINYESNTGIVRIVASPHPTGEANDYNGLRLTQKELEQKAFSLDNKPILYEHGNQNSEPIGRWVGGFVDQNGRMIALGEIDTNKFLGTKAVEEIRKGEMSGVSLGLIHYYDSKENKIVFKEVEEISVTKNPALIAPILAIEQESKRDKFHGKAFDTFRHILKQREHVEQNIKKLRSKMSSESAPIANNEAANQTAQPNANAQERPQIANQGNAPQKRPREEENPEKTLEEVKQELKQLYNLKDEEKLLKEQIASTDGRSETEKTSTEVPSKKPKLTGAPEKPRLNINSDTELEAAQWYESLKKNGNDEAIKEFMVRQAAQNIETIKERGDILQKWLKNVQKNTGKNMAPFFSLLKQARLQPFEGRDFTDGLNTLHELVTKASAETGNFAELDKKYSELTKKIDILQKENKALRRYYEETEKYLPDSQSNNQKQAAQVKQPEPVKESVPKNDVKQNMEEFYSNWGVKKPGPEIKFQTGKGLQISPISDDPLMTQWINRKGAVEIFSSAFSAIPSKVDGPFYPMNAINSGNLTLGGVPQKDF